VSSGRNNKLTGQIGEYLVCAELGKRNLIATPFAGNVPAFDVLATDEFCRTVPIQVKTTRGDNWPTDARTWMNIQFDEKTKTQNNLGRVKIKNRDLIYVFVAIASDEKSKDRFFILTKSQLQDVCIKGYSEWMDGRDWKRPRSPESYDCRFWISEVENYENNWKLISDRLASASPDQSLESPEE
jgi:hypothetical protein